MYPKDNECCMNEKCRSNDARYPNYCKTFYQIDACQKAISDNAWRRFWRKAIARLSALAKKITEAL